MVIRVNGIFAYNNISFFKNNIDGDLYQLTIGIARKEKGIKNHNIHYQKENLNLSLVQSLEIIKSINNYKNIQEREVGISTPNIKHRVIFNFNSSLQKQIFINNYIFMDSEKFTRNIINNGITKEQIDELISAIEEKKKQAKIDKNYNLELDGIFPIDKLVYYYDFNQPEIIINRLLEIKYNEPELIDKLYKIK